MPSRKRQLQRDEGQLNCDSVGGAASEVFFFPPLPFYFFFGWVGLLWQFVFI